MQPLISIVIANYNYGRFLETALQSVLRQCDEALRLPTGDMVEMIIVDGGSVDNSIEVIKKYSDKLTWWCSEKDRGQSDAFNKGFSKARGRFLTWLNADDILLPNAIAHLKQGVEKYPSCEWFVGGCFWLNCELQVLKCSRARPFSFYKAKQNEIPVWAPSSFFTKTLLDRVGGVDINFHYGMDTELWNRFWKFGNVFYRPIPVYCWGLRIHPDAKMSGHQFPGSEHAKLTHPKWRQIQKEGNFFKERYGVPSHPKWFSRWLGLSFQFLIASRYDTWRFKGRYYLDCVTKKEFV